RRASAPATRGACESKPLFGGTGSGGWSWERFGAGGPSHEPLRWGREAIFLSIWTGQKWLRSPNASSDKGQSGGRWIINSANRYSSYSCGTVIGLSLIPAVKSVVQGLVGVGGMTWTLPDGSPRTISCKPFFSPRPQRSSLC